LIKTTALPSETEQGLEYFRGEAALFVRWLIILPDGFCIVETAFQCQERGVGDSCAKLPDQPRNAENWTVTNVVGGVVERPMK